MSKINQTPRGLQSLLGNVNQGDNPAELDGTVKSGFDMLPYWGVEKTKFRVTSQSAAHVIGQGVEMIVPAGELWIPVVVSANGFCLAEQGGAIMLHITDEALSARPIISQSPYVNATSATKGIACSSNIEGRYIMSPGTRFRAEWLEADGATTNATMNIDLMYYALRG